MKNPTTIPFLFLLFFGLNIKAQKSEKLVQYVNPLIGTEKMGHTYPGATAPFGAVQLSPETDTISYEMNGKYNGDVYKYCAGYRYEDKRLLVSAQPILAEPDILIWEIFS